MLIPANDRFNRGHQIPRPPRRLNVVPVPPPPQIAQSAGAFTLPIAAEYAGSFKQQLKSLGIESPFEVLLEGGGLPGLVQRFRDEQSNFDRAISWLEGYFGTETASPRRRGFIPPRRRQEDLPVGQDPNKDDFVDWIFDYDYSPNPGFPIGQWEARAPLSSPPMFITTEDGTQWALAYRIPNNGDFAILYPRWVEFRWQPVMQNLRLKNPRPKPKPKAPKNPAEAVPYPPLGNPYPIPYPYPVPGAPPLALPSAKPNRIPPRPNKANPGVFPRFNPNAPSVPQPGIIPGFIPDFFPLFPRRRGVAPQPFRNPAAYQQYLLDASPRNFPRSPRNSIPRSGLELPSLCFDPCIADIHNAVIPIEQEVERLFLCAPNGVPGEDEIETVTLLVPPVAGQSLAYIADELLQISRDNCVKAANLIEALAELEERQSEIAELKRLLEELNPEATEKARIPSYPGTPKDSGASGTVDLPDDTYSIRLTIEEGRNGFNSQFGGTYAPNVIFAGWYAWGYGSLGWGDRKPLHYASIELRPPSGATRFSFTITNGGTATPFIVKGIAPTPPSP